MAKETYKIPNDLATNYLDVKIALRTNSGSGLPPLPLKSILFWVISFFLMVIIVAKTPIHEGGLGLTILFCVFWLILTFILGKCDNTGRMNLELVPVLISYMSKSSRTVKTRTSDDVYDFFRITGIAKIDDDGFLTFSDGSKGYCFRVVGNASYLLFEEDKKYILDGVDSFFRSIGHDFEIIFITNKEAQNVNSQLVALNNKYKKLKVDDEDLDALVTEQWNLLTRYVGSVFKSTHQFMIVKGDNMEALRAGLQAVKADAEHSGRVFKRLITMEKPDFLKIQKGLYTIPERFDTKKIQDEYDKEKG